MVLLGLFGAGALAWLLFGFFGIQALFLDRHVQDAVPLLVSSEEMDELIATTSTLNAAEAVRLLQGEGMFMQGDSTYRISGKGSVYQEGKMLHLALTDFDVTNGPDLYVYVVDTASTDNATVKTAVASGAFVSLGKLKGNIGDQVYEIPDGVDLKNRVVSIWCKRFSRNFGSALIQ